MQNEAVGHARDIVRHHARQTLRLDLLHIARRKLLRFAHPEIEQLAHHLLRLFVLPRQRRAGIQRVVQVPLLLLPLRFGRRRERRQPRRMVSHLLQAVHAGRLRILQRSRNQVVGQHVLHQLQRLVEQELRFDAAVLPLHLRIAVGQNVHVPADVVDLQQPRLHPVIQVCGQIGDLVRQVDNLRLQRRPQPQQVPGKLRELLGAIVARVLDDSFAHAQRQVQPAMRRVALLEVLHDAQRVQVVVEAQPVPLQAFIQRAFPGVPERRVADVVDQRQRLCQVLVQPQRLGHAARDLYHFDGVRQPAAKMVGGAAGKHLRLARQPAKRARLHNPFAVPLERRPRRPFRRGMHPRHQHIVRAA